MLLLQDQIQILFLLAEFGLVSIWVFINLLLLKSASCAGDSGVGKQFLFLHHNMNQLYVFNV